MIRIRNVKLSADDGGIHSQNRKRRKCKEPKLPPDPVISGTGRASAYFSARVKKKSEGFGEITSDFWI